MPLMRFGANLWEQSGSVAGASGDILCATAQMRRDGAMSACRR